MNNPQINFESLPWEVVATGAREKRIVCNGTVVRLLELTSSFVEPDWCAKGHVGYVVEVTFEVHFRDRTIAFKAGDGLFIDTGIENKHKAVIAGRVLLFLVE